MLAIQQLNHLGIRISQKQRTLDFYQLLGFRLIEDAGYDSGHPLIIQHPCGLTLNLLGPSSIDDGVNRLMDIKEKYTGVTHIALTVENLDDAKDFLRTHQIAETGSFQFGKMSAVFFRDPDRNVIELDAYEDT